jgi:8-oxo-dGTP pyrophosphatase MutT (NUDIX family)
MFTEATASGVIEPLRDSDGLREIRDLLRTLVFRLFITLRALWVPTALGVAGAVFDEGGRVLLVKHRYNPGWRLPGGGVGRGEPPHAAILRELREEVGLVGGQARFFSLYTRRAGWVTSAVALYRIEGAKLDFRPNLEIREICFADPLVPPADASPATLRRLKELTGTAVPADFW